MITTHNITIFIGLTGLAMALAGHAWPGVSLAIVAIIAIIGLAPTDDIDGPSEVDDGAIPFYDDERSGENDWVARKAWHDRVTTEIYVTEAGRQFGSAEPN